MGPAPPKNPRENFRGLWDRGGCARPDPRISWEKIQKIGLKPIVKPDASCGLRTGEVSMRINESKIRKIIREESRILAEGDDQYQRRELAHAIEQAIRMSDELSARPGDVYARVTERLLETRELLSGDLRESRHPAGLGKFMELRHDPAAAADAVLRLLDDSSYARDLCKDVSDGDHGADIELNNLIMDILNMNEDEFGRFDPSNEFTDAVFDIMCKRVWTHRG